MYVGMRLRTSTVLPLVLALVAACGGGKDSGERARLDAIDQRLDALDQRLAAIDQSLPTGERLRSDLQSLEQRVSAVESKATQALENARNAPPAATPPAKHGAKRDDIPAPARIDTAARRAQLSALMLEYRQRLDAVRRQGAASPEDQMAARRAVRDWYIARRRAILAGVPPPD